MLVAEQLRVMQGRKECGVRYRVGISDYVSAAKCSGGYTLVSLPRIVTPYRDSVDVTRDHVTYQKVVTR